MHETAHNHHHETQATTPEQRLAVLRYMLDHNQHHAEELHELGHEVSSEAAALIHEAVDLFEQSNEKLVAALQILENEA